MAGQLLEGVIRAAEAAGQEVLEVYGRAHEVETKQDGSPVTEADHRAQAVICRHLAELDPGVLVVAEEDAERASASDASDRFWLVDPLDGTKEFVGRSHEFTINIALIESGHPVLGVVFAPALGRLFGAEPGTAFVQDESGRNPVSARAIPADGATVVSSRSHGDPDALARFESDRPIKDSITIGSSLKFCLVATGEADLYPRFGRTMEWDTAAGHAVLRAAGGRVVDMEGRLLRYGKPGWENPFFLALGRD
ncbi:MAG TPA: 3'(2'),5'-bisphosphate nucleotidase CysQ [Solirubrobacteraceae bacterium]|nr:3'(2'),5'-bisphosphate nucleotidase CysQ [Solirubrobacteraceae bacterium]